MDGGPRPPFRKKPASFDVGSMAEARRDAYIICLGPRGRAKALFLASVCGGPSPAGEPDGLFLARYTSPDTTRALYRSFAAGGGVPPAWLEDVDLRPFNAMGQPSREDYQNSAAVFIIYDVLQPDGLSQARDVLTRVLSLWGTDLEGTIALVGIREVDPPADDVRPQSTAAPAAGQRYSVKHVAGAVLPNGEQVLQYQVDISVDAASAAGLRSFQSSAAQNLVRDVLDAASRKQKVEFDPYEL